MGEPADGKRGPKFVTNEYTYLNQQNPTTLWYHVKMIQSNIFR